MGLYDSVIITGGGGMLAHALLRALAAGGRRAVALRRADCDLTRPADIDRAFAEHHPTLVLNTAAHTRVDLCESQEALATEINGHGVGRLAAAAKRHGAVLVHYSTDFVFDGASSRPYRPEDPVNPLSAYGRSKLFGEQALIDSAPPRWLIIRTAWLYGRNGPSFPRTMVERARAGQPLKVVNDQVGSPTYTEDLAAGTMALLDSGAAGIWHLTNAGTASWFDFAQAALQEFGVSAEAASISTADWVRARPQQAPRPLYSVLDTSPFALQTGRPPRPWRDALRDFRDAVQRDGFS